MLRVNGNSFSIPDQRDDGRFSRRIGELVGSIRGSDRVAVDLFDLVAGPETAAIHGLEYRWLGIEDEIDFTVRLVLDAAIRAVVGRDAERGTRPFVTLRSLRQQWCG